MKHTPGTALAVALLMSACGGGSSPSTPPPAPPAPVVSISGVTPQAAVIGTPTTFDVSGINLPVGMQFALAGCSGTTELAGGTSAMRQFTCTPISAVTASKGQVSTGGDAAVRFDFTVDYRSPIRAAVASGGRMALIKADGTLWSWGYLSGDGNEQAALVPRKIGSGFAEVNAGLGATLAVKEDGTLWSWGGGELLGSESAFRALAPIQIGSGFNKVSVEWRGTSSGEHAIGLKSDGSLWVWGARGMPTGQYGMQRTPRMFASGFSALGSNDTALKQDGSVWSWQVNASVILPTDPPDTSYMPRQVGAGYTALAGGFSVEFGLRADGTLWNWGGYALRPPGAGADPDMHFQVDSGVRSIVTAPGRPLVIKSDNTLWTAGADKPLLPGQFISAWANDSCLMALKTDGTLWLRGLCFYGDGDFARYNKPGATAEQLVLPK